MTVCCSLVMLAMLTWPAEAQEARDVWRGLRWDMSIDRASQTLSRQGLKVTERRHLKDPARHFSAEAEGWRATVYFNEQGRMNQILVITETLTKEAAAAAKERLTKRFGAVKDTTLRTEQMWGARISKDPWTKLFVAHIPDEGWIAREEYGHGDARDPVGVFGLTWGQTASVVEQGLRTAGFEARTAAMDPDPCEMQNAPMLCDDANIVVHFKKGNDEGSAEVHEKRGLQQVTFRARVASHADGVARAKSIEAFRGPASEIEESTLTEWSDATTDVELDVSETKPKGTLSAMEIYRPRSTAKSASKS